MATKRTVTEVPRYNSFLFANLHHPPLWKNNMGDYSYKNTGIGQKVYPF